MIKRFDVFSYEMVNECSIPPGSQPEIFQLANQIFQIEPSEIESLKAQILKEFTRRGVQVSWSEAIGRSEGGSSVLYLLNQEDEVVAQITVVERYPVR